MAWVKNDFPQELVPFTKLNFGVWAGKLRPYSNSLEVKFAHACLSKSKDVNDIDFTLEFSLDASVKNIVDRLLKPLMSVRFILWVSILFPHLVNFFKAFIDSCQLIVRVKDQLRLYYLHRCKIKLLEEFVWLNVIKLPVLVILLARAEMVHQLGCISLIQVAYWLFLNKLIYFVAIVDIDSPFLLHHKDDLQIVGLADEGVEHILQVVTADPVQIDHEKNNTLLLKELDQVSMVAIKLKAFRNGILDTWDTLFIGTIYLEDAIFVHLSVYDVNDSLLSNWEGTALLNTPDAM